MAGSSPAVSARRSERVREGARGGAAPSISSWAALLTRLSVLAALPLVVASLVWSDLGPPAAANTPSSTTTTSPTGASSTGTGTITVPARLSPSPAGSATDQNTAATTWVLKAIAAEKQMGSVHLDGTIKQGSSLITLHLVVNGDGDGTGHFTESGSPIQLSRRGQAFYFKATKRFWAGHASKAQAAKYGGTWLELSALNPHLADFDRFLNASDLVAAAFTGHSVPLTLHAHGTVAGHKVVVITEKTPTGGRGTTLTMAIASTGQPYVYRITDDSPTAKSTLNFSRYGKPIQVVVPKHVVNLTTTSSSSTTTSTATTTATTTTP